MNDMITNPVLRGFNPDPSILRVGKDYYIATSTFQWFPGVLIYKSRDLINWELVSRPLQSEQLLNLRGVPDSGGVWAPDLSYHNGKFWLIYSNVKSLDGAFKDTPNFLTTTNDISGEWSEPIYLNSNGFDASMFHDEDGKHYLLNMVWDHRVYNHQFYGIQMREYSYEESRLVGEPKIIWKGNDVKLAEGPHLYKINNFYYLFCAQGGTQWSHQEVAARSNNLWGPYNGDPNGCFLTTVDTPHYYMQKAGHASMVQTEEGDYYIAHLMSRPLHYDKDSVIEPRGWCPLGRETSIQKLEWSKEGWPKIVGGLHGSKYVESIGKCEENQCVNEKSSITTFENDELDNEFQTVRVPFEEIGTITDEHKLELYGRESPSSLFTFAQVSRRWQSFDFIAETKMTFQPTNFQQFAGMLNYYDSENYSMIYVTYDEQRNCRVLEVLICDANQPQYLFKSNGIVVPENTESVFFRTIEKDNQYKYSYSLDGEVFNDVISLDSLKLSDDYIMLKYGPSANFTGAFVGMFAVDLTGAQKSAKFDYFKYLDR